MLFHIFLLVCLHTHIAVATAFKQRLRIHNTSPPLEMTYMTTDKSVIAN